MLLPRPTLLVLASYISLVLAKNSDLTACLARIQSGALVLPPNSTLDSTGRPTNATNATAIPYSVCVRECGPYPAAFDWTTFSTNFSTWMLPWLALLSQLPFGSRQWPNIMSVLLTLGSPALAAYSLILCVFNWNWVPSAFKGIDYPNVVSACLVLGSLQHVPLQVDQTPALLAGLVVLPENDQWWHTMDEGLNYQEDWSTALFLQIVWVVVAYVFTIMSAMGEGPDDFQTSGRGTSTLFVWLLFLVIGWQRFLPRCGYARVIDVLRQANTQVYEALMAPPISTGLNAQTLPSPRVRGEEAHRRRDRENAQYMFLRKRSDSFPFCLTGEYRGDHDAGASIYSYARLIPWSKNVELVAGAFRAAAHVAAVRDIDVWKQDDARRNSLPQVMSIIRHYVRPIDWKTILKSCMIANVLAMALHWGNIGSAILYFYDTPTTGLGCRSGALLVYACLGTIIHIFMVVSSFLTHHASTEVRERRRNSIRELARPAFRLSPQTIGLFSTVLRRTAKALAALNAIIILATCMSLFSNVFTNCWCNASFFPHGFSTFTTIAVQPYDEASMLQGWSYAMIFSWGSTIALIVCVYAFTRPVKPADHSRPRDAAIERRRRGTHRRVPAQTRS
ncbi:unnamed protein product [Peniophora sp. CBMAI 1063]|nr:unnamed protein product [Peniophora sp. CBMAI 1063]